MSTNEEADASGPAIDDPVTGDPAIASAGVPDIEEPGSKSPYPDSGTGLQDVPPDEDDIGDRAPVTGAAALQRARAEGDCSVGMCLKYVRTWLGVGAKYPSAWEAWKHSEQHAGDRTPPIGAPVFYRGGQFGHIALYAGNGRIVSTDCASNGKVREADLDWPQQRWGHVYVGWASTLNGVRLPIGAAGALGDVGNWKAGPVYVNKLKPGQKDSDSVRRLQARLNAVADAGLPVTGNYLAQTKAAVLAWQKSVGDTGAAADGVMGPNQSRRLFPDPPFTVIG